MPTQFHRAEHLRLQNKNYEQILRVIGGARPDCLKCTASRKTEATEELSKTLRFSSVGWLTVGAST